MPNTGPREAQGLRLADLPETVLPRDQPVVAEGPDIAAAHVNADAVDGRAVDRPFGEPPSTRESMRGRGIASALIRASHKVASARGIEQALLHATPAGRPVYARAGYLEERALPVLAFP